MRIERTHYRQPVHPTPFHSRTAALCETNEWGRWAGYTTVERYTEVAHEYFAIRNKSSLFDLTPMIKYRITGPDATRCLDRVMTRDVARLPVDRVAYTVWCNDRGEVLDDGTLFRLDAEAYLLCAQDRHLDWLLDSAYGFEVTIEDRTDAIAALALQGPTSCAVLKAMGLRAIEQLRPFRLARFALEGSELRVSRTGYTGDLGYELWVDPDRAETLWDRLMEAGAAHGLRPIGGQALKLARVEAGLLLPHVDFMPAAEAQRPGRGRSPFALGLGWLVDFRKGHFTGRRALLEESRTGPRQRVVGLDVDGRRPAHDAYIYRDRTREVGHVTSALWSPTCKRNIAIATLQADCLARPDNLWAEIHVCKELRWEKRVVRARVVDRVFYDPPRRWATPPPDF